MHFRRVIVEHIGQALTIGTGLLDRLVLTAVLLRTWGDAEFERWSVCLAAAGLVSLFDFGFSLYFNNRLMEETEQGRPDEAGHTLRLANTVCGSAGSLAFMAVAAIAVFWAPAGWATSPQGFAIMCLTAASALKIAATGIHSLYRAHRQYARLAFMQAIGDLVRITSAIVVCGLGGGLVTVAITVTTVTIGLQVVVPAVVALHSFAPGQAGFEPVRRREFAGVFGTSLAFFAQLVPIILVAYLPVLYLGQRHASSGILAAFVLMRTLSGVPRALLQQFGAVLGQECGRRIAVRDQPGALALITEGARLFAVLSGLATGLLLAGGASISAVWTGSAEYFRFDYVIVAVAPMVLVAFAVLAHNILVTTNAPLFGTAGRWVQLLVTGLCIVALPISDSGLAMLAALSIGEVVGFAPLAYVGICRLVTGVDVWFFIKECVISIVSCGIGVVLTWLPLTLVGDGTATDRMAAMGLATLLVAAIIPWIGVRPTTRRALVQQFVQPRLAMISAAFRG